MIPRSSDGSLWITDSAEASFVAQDAAARQYDRAVAQHRADGKAEHAVEALECAAIGEVARHAIEASAIREAIRSLVPDLRAEALDAHAGHVAYASVCPLCEWSRDGA